MSRSFGLSMSVAVLLSVAVLGCRQNAPVPVTPGSASKSLYDRLGGENAIKQVVDDLVARAAADPRVNFVRTGHPRTWDPNADDNMKDLKTHLVQFICKATGGPQQYEGESMKKAHEHMEITQDEWNAFADDLKATLNHFAVGQQEQGELLAIVASTHDDIVNQ